MRLASISTTASVAHAPSRIMGEIAAGVADRGGRSLIIYGRGGDVGYPGVTHIRVGSRRSILTHAAMSRTFGRQGLMSRRATAHAIDALKAFRPDIVHLHILHGHYINYPMLTEALAGMDVPVVMTLHDMWPLTGRCCFPAGCEHWTDGCAGCTDRHTYPPTLFTMSRLSHKLRAGLFNRLPDITLVAPSQWMATQAGRSALKLCPTVVIPNGVDTSVFRRHDQSGKGAGDRFRILTIANHWEHRKRLDRINDMIPMLKPDEELIVAGAARRDLRPSPNVITLPLTTDLAQLARTYNEADVTVSASEAESFGMTIAESIACGTPVVVPPGGALAELPGPADGLVAATPDAAGLYDAVCRIRSGRFNPTPRWSADDMVARYITLFNDLMS